MCKYCGEKVNEDVNLSVGNWNVLTSRYTKECNRRYMYEYETLTIIALGDGIANVECLYCFNCGREIITNEKAFDKYWDS